MRSLAPPLRTAIVVRRARRQVASHITVAATLIALACAGKSERVRATKGDDSATTTSSAAPRGAASAAVSDTTCPKEGNWRLCSVEDRLVHAGLVVEKRDAPVHRDFLRVAGTAYQVGVKDDVVEVFVYPTSEARKRDTDLLDSATASPKGTRIIYGAPPTLVMSNNMAAIVLSLNDRTVERLALALGAGLPMPDKKD